MTHTCYINDKEVVIEGKTNISIVKKLKKMAAVDCRKHTKQVIFSEFRDHAWGIYFWDRINGSLLAFIEFDERKVV